MSDPLDSRPLSAGLTGDQPLTPLQDAIDRIKDEPGQAVVVGVVVTKVDQGVSIEVDKDLGKGWWVGAEGGWWRKAGGFVAAKVGWYKR